MISKSEILDKIMSDIKERTDTPKLPTGIADIDYLTWGVHKKELMVLAARPSHGKTSLALNMAWGIAKLGRSVIFLSLEMSKEAVFERIMCIEFDIHGWKLRTGNKEEIEKAIASQDKFRARLLRTPFEVFDGHGKTISSVENVLQTMKPEVLFVDYVQKISARGFGSKYEAISDYVVKLQSLAIEHNCAIVVNSQVNRMGSKVDNATDFMKGSGEIEESSDCLLQLNWLFRDDPSRMDSKEYVVRAVKQRHGPCSQVTLDFDAASFRFESRPFYPKEKP